MVIEYTYVIQKDLFDSFLKHGCRGGTEFIRIKLARIKEYSGDFGCRAQKAAFTTLDATCLVCNV
jgi:hypothetical protein